MLAEADYSGIVARGGTILGSSRTVPLNDDASMSQLVSGVDRLALDALVAIGGDGTLSLARRLSERGVRIVGVPKTIDFDVDYTEVCIGFDSALATVVDALDRLHTTAASHHRVMVLETMGGHSGWLAALGGLAGGADVVCIPEFPIEIAEIASRLIARRDAGKESSIVIVAEGTHVLGIDEEPVPYDEVGHPHLARRAIGETIASAIESMIGGESRATVLGYLQRGGAPVATDRVWASRLGAAAAALARTSGADAVAVHDGQVVETSLATLTDKRRLVPESLYELCRIVG